MMVAETFDTRPIQASDRMGLANMLVTSAWLHRHLDWRSVMDWMDSYPFLIIEKSGLPAAALACPPSPPSVAWIRLFGKDQSLPLGQTWAFLWKNALEELREMKSVYWAASISLDPWFSSLLKSSGFKVHNRVVPLSWEVDKILPGLPFFGGMIRPMLCEDLPAVTALDLAAFIPLWQLTLDDMNEAFQQAIYATIFELDGRILGYQVSTPTQNGGHLARLAIHPEVQGRGYGKLLVLDVLERFRQSGAKVVTVNTQEDNRASLALYHRLGFEISGESYPVYLFEIHPTETSKITGFV